MRTVLDRIMGRANRKAEVQFPTGKCQLTKLLSSMHKVNNDGNDLSKPFFFDLDISDSFGTDGLSIAEGYVMCLTRCRCGSRGYWSSRHKRRLELFDMLQLQVIIVPT